MALKLLNTVLSGSSDGEEDLLFVECIKRLDNEKIKLIGEHLFKLQNEGDKRVDSLISKAKQVFARVHYTGGKSVFVIYNEQQVVPFFSESIIELWNHEIIDMPECFFDAFINKAFAINRKLLQHAICEKIASSFISNDYLLLFCALVANSRTYFERIKDYSILSTWLVKQTAFFRYHLPSFLKLSKYCPIYELKKAISIITAPQLLDYLSGNEAPLQCLPQELLVKIEVVINVSSEKQVVESTDWHGGYFTWGEGKKGEHYEINTYLRKEFDASYYTVTPQSVIISYIQDELKGKFSSYTKKFVESKNMSNCFMGITVDQEDYFVQLSLCSHESLDSTFLFSLRNFADVLLSTETIYE